MAENSQNISWLYQAPSGEVEPPIDTSAQELPFEKLRWEDFEKLCLCLAKLESDIDICRQYGVQGDEQHGIDIFAKTKDANAYTVYQCKNEKGFSPTP